MAGAVAGGIDFALGGDGSFGRGAVWILIRERESPCPMPFAPGTKLGPYEILELISVCWSARGEPLRCVAWQLGDLPISLQSKLYQAWGEAG